MKLFRHILSRLEPINNYSKFQKDLLLMAIFFGCTFSLASQNEAVNQDFVLIEGAKGKDVIWLPTHQLVIETMLDMANVGSEDIFYDLGSGDGRLVIEAAQRGALATGIEYEPELVEHSKKMAEQQGIADKALFYKADLFEFDFSNASVISLFLTADLNLKLRPSLLALKPGTRIISNSFDMGDWTPYNQTVVEYIEVEQNEISTTRRLKKVQVYFWIVPENFETKKHQD